MAIKLDKSIWHFAILISSFFICIPLGRFSFAGFASDFRIYDYFSLLFILLYWKKIKKWHKVITKSPHFFTFYAKWLCIIVGFSVFFTLIHRGVNYMPPTLIRLFRYFLYFSSATIAITLVDTLKKFKFIIWVIFINISIQTILAFLQGIDLIPSFWPDYWLKAYEVENVPVGTLSPHHKHIAVVMLLGIPLAMGLIKVSKNLLIKVVLIPMIFLMIAVPLFPATKTFVFSVIGLILGFFYINKVKGFPILLVLVLAGFILFPLVNASVYTSIEDQLDHRLLRFVEKWNFSKITTGRDKVYNYAFDALLEYPYLFVTGTGFQGISAYIPATGAHNNFLQYLMEAGIAGLVFFILLIRQIHKNLFWAIKNASSIYEREMIKHIWIGFVGVFFSLFSGEVLYAQYSMFTLPGLILILFGVAISLFFWRKFNQHLSNKNVTPVKSSIKELI
ncbi:MAG: O-antigen ligase family protein [Ignavibacteriales bacterium]|nr:O-antigen ligase family protein [Ignavibacteriales bacterium]